MGKTIVLHDAKTNEVIAIGFDDVWALPVSMGVRVFNAPDEPVLIDNGGKVYLRQNAFITKID